MAHIKSRKHSGAVYPAVNQSLLALAALATPFAVQAQRADANSKILPAVEVHTSSGTSYKAEQSASPKRTQPLVDTPQTISVIKKEIIEQQGATTLTEALKNTPGVGTFFLGENGSTNTGDAIFMRGFDSSDSIFVDGIRDLGSVSRDVFNIEQIEVNKGPTGVDYGRSSPTGSVNLITKQPLLKDVYSGSLGVGTDNYLRGTADLNRVTGDQSAFRLNLMSQRSGVPGRSIVENDKNGVAAAFGFGLKSSTRTYLNFLHVNQNNIPDNGVPTIGLPGYSSPDPARPQIGNAPRVNSSNYYGSASDFDDEQADMFTAIVEHDISDHTMLRNITRYGKNTQNYLLTSYTSSAANFSTPNLNDPSTWSITRNIRTLKDQQNEILTNQTNLKTTLQFGTVEHEITSGFELIREKQDTTGYNGTGTLPNANLYNPNPYDPVSGLNLTPNGAGSQGKTDTVGAYLFDTMKVGKLWQFLAGLRLDHYSTDYHNAYLSTARSDPALPVGTLVQQDFSDSGNLLNWKTSALYKPAENGSVYVSYATSKQPPGGSDFALSGDARRANNPAYDPQEANTVEVGTKWDLMNKKLGLTAALYNTEVSNEVVQDPGTLLYTQTGKKQVQGLELGMVGQINRNWNVNAGYTLMNTKVASGTSVTADGSNNLAYTPRNAFTAWTTYTLPKGWTVGGGARYVGSLQRGTDGAVGTPDHTESYWVVDAMAAYRINKNMDLQLNVNNLFDTDYVAAINKSGYRYTPGTPRSAMLTLNFKY